MGAVGAVAVALLKRGRVAPEPEVQGDQAE